LIDSTNCPTSNNIRTGWRETQHTATCGGFLWAEQMFGVVASIIMYKTLYSVGPPKIPSGYENPACMLDHTSLLRVPASTVKYINRVQSRPHLFLSFLNWHLI
jgi:hypothetical protein